MSVASLTNETLYLTYFGVNNSKYSDVSGYVPKQAIIGGTVNTVYMSIPDGLSIGGTLQLTNGSNVLNLSNDGNSNLNVDGSISTDGSIGIGNGTLQLGNTTTGIINVVKTSATNIEIQSDLTVTGDITAETSLTVGNSPNQTVLTCTNPNQLTVDSGLGQVLSGVSTAGLFNGGGIAGGQLVFSATSGSLVLGGGGYANITINIPWTGITLLPNVYLNFTPLWVSPSPYSTQNGLIFSYTITNYVNNILTVKLYILNPLPATGQVLGGLYWFGYCGTSNTINYAVDSSG